MHLNVVLQLFTVVLKQKLNALRIAGIAACLHSSHFHTIGLGLRTYVKTRLMHHSPTSVNTQASRSPGRELS